MDDYLNEAYFSFVSHRKSTITYDNYKEKFRYKNILQKYTLSSKKSGTLEIWKKSPNFK